MNETSQMALKQRIRNSYNQIAEQFHQQFCTRNIYNPDFRDLFDFYEREIPEASQCLDLGCGSGNPFTKRLATHFRVTGVDYSSTQVERARQNVSDAEFRCIDINDLTYPSGQFDLITCFFSLFHLPLSEQRDLITRVGTWLKPGGWFSLVYTALKEAGEGYEQDWCGAEMFWFHLPSSEYEELADAAGLKKIRDFISEEDGLPAWRVGTFQKVNT